jgi:hypothetical protein
MSGAGPSLYPGAWPSWSVFKFPPDPEPRAIPPPYDEHSFRNPFPISTETYNAALSTKVPLTIASVYAVTVVILNRYNRSHGNKPWAISKTRLFKAFVIFHNVFLAVYSAATCVAMVRALKHSIPHYTEHNAVVGAVDALCKMHGPRGLGDAATYNTTTNTWGIKNSLIHLGDNQLPDNTDVGRIWNEGLAWWGWIFYLSKFYEVLDTAIIIAKGKRSTTLQTYHHSGAMLSMWAGMRYMSPPIWMFVLVNSGIHAMMYTYYTVSALGFRVPNAVKRSLTSLQILQFVVGTFYAAIHLFVSYTVPVIAPYEKIVSQPLSSASSLAASATSSETLVAATGVAIAFLKKLVYRAAGEEGLAENMPGASNFGYLNHAHPNRPQQALHEVKETVYRREYQAIPCIDTSGQAFAIYLNLIYLAPLTGLFVRFFVKSYLRRTSASTKHTTKKHAISKARHDAVQDVDREIESLGQAAEDSIGNGVKAAKKNVKAATENAKAVKDNLRGRTTDPDEKRTGSLSPANKKFVDSITQQVNQRLDQMGEIGEAASQKTKKFVQDRFSNASSSKGPSSERETSQDSRDEKVSNGQKSETSREQTDKAPTNGVKDDGEKASTDSNGIQSEPAGVPIKASFVEAATEGKQEKVPEEPKGDESFMEVKKEDGEEKDSADRNGNQSEAAEIPINKSFVEAATEGKDSKDTNGKA